jgi:hypothetical protein
MGEGGRSGRGARLFLRDEIFFEEYSFYNSRAQTLVIVTGLDA